MAATEAKNKVLTVLKTYKMYIGGKFPRTESGRIFKYNVQGKHIANVCRASRKDLREAVVLARKAQPSWAARSAFNRSQILYRIAEMLEGRKMQFIEEIISQGATRQKAEKEVHLAIDSIVYYAGWADKYQQVFSAVNPVASNHFNFSLYEPTGLVFCFVKDKSSLLGLVSALMPIIVSGNTCIVLGDSEKPLSAITFAEVLNSSDVPSGVVNILSGFSEELILHAGKHLDINAIAYCGQSSKELTELKELAISNVKRIIHLKEDAWNEKSQNPYRILDFCEVKTTWHPIEKIGSSGSGY